MPVINSLIMVIKVKHEGKAGFQTLAVGLVSGLRNFPKEEILEPSFPETVTRSD